MTRKLPLEDDDVDVAVLTLQQRKERLFNAWRGEIYEPPRTSTLPVETEGTE